MDQIHQIVARSLGRPVRAKTTKRNAATKRRYETVCTSTERTYGRSRTIGAQWSPPSEEQ
jgi:hypothetical protein